MCLHSSVQRAHLRVTLHCCCGEVPHLHKLSTSAAPLLRFVLLAGSSASGLSCTQLKWDKKGQWNYSSLLLTVQGFLKMYCFTFFLLEDSKHVFPVCKGLDLLSQFPCWWAHLFLFETQGAGYIFYLFQHLCKPNFRKRSGGAGAGWRVNVMNGISYPHVQASTQACFICMEVEGYEQQLECSFLFIIHLVKSLFCCVCLSCNHICSSYLHTLWMCLDIFSSWCKFWVTALSLVELLFSYNSLTGHGVGAL